MRVPAAPAEWGRRQPPRSGGVRAHGFALVAVIWMLAALALLVSALVAGVRAEVRMVQGLRDAVEATALADAAIHSILRELVVDADRPVRASVRTVEWEGHRIEVWIYPVEGFIDLNTAPEPLLALLFMHGGGADRSSAETLARAVVDWRTPRTAERLQTFSGVDTAKSRARFDVIEDLLQVAGMDFALFDRIRGLVTTDSGVFGVDPLAAPESVLAVLAEGDLARVADIVARRAADDPLTDTTELAHAQPNSASSSHHRLDAWVRSPDGRVRVRTVWTRIGASGNGSLPWEILQSEPVRGQGVAGAP